MTKTNNFKHFFILFAILLQFFVTTSFLYLNIPLNSTANSLCLEKPQSNISNKLTSAEGMAVIESSSGRLLYSSNENKRLPMASTTKIITAIVAIENCAELDKKHEIPKESVGIEGSSIYLRAGEHLSVRELLYGLMLRSGNDSAVAIAIIVGGSVENFVSMMNQYVSNLGLTDTNIVTVNGLHDESHYTSAHDLALITAKALQNSTFAEIVSTKFKTIDNENGKNSKVRYLKNKNKLLWSIDGADGVKTGYTKKAGRCFVGSATRNGMNVVCVVLNCGPMFEETAALINKAFCEYKLVKLFTAGEITMADVPNGKTQKVPILLKKDIIFPLRANEINKAVGRVTLFKELSAPLDGADAIGEVKIELENNLIFSEKLYTISVEEKPELKDFIKKIIKAF